MENKILLDNGKVQITTTQEVNRYQGYYCYSQSLIDMTTEDIKEQNKIWMTKHSREGFNCLDTNENWEPEHDSVAEDIESFQKYLDETYGKDKYEAYAVGAYIHSAVSFQISKGPDTRCPWDSGTVGFIGINKECNYDVDYLASTLSDCWNGYLAELQIYDIYNEDVVDSILNNEPFKVVEEWKAKMKEQYGVTDYQQQD